nr:uncharacterized protein LOC124808169 isoform X1 [Hydra vulgaris]
MYVLLIYLLLVVYGFPICCNINFLILVSTSCATPVSTSCATPVISTCATPGKFQKLFSFNMCMHFLSIAYSFLNFLFCNCISYQLVFDENFLFIVTSSAVTSIPSAPPLNDWLLLVKYDHLNKKMYTRATEYM